jgi:glycosyltransferase involved in cell wall biosynthesis
LNYLKESSNVILTGLIENNIEYYYELMDVLVLPTLREGLGTSILEASSMAKPVLASDHTGSKDAMIDGLTGSYIKPTVKSISENISAYLEDSEMLMTHGEQGRVFILNNFSQELIWAEIEEKLYLSK